MKTPHSPFLPHPQLLPLQKVPGWFSFSQVVDVSPFSGSNDSLRHCKQRVPIQSLMSDMQVSTGGLECAQTRTVRHEQAQAACSYKMSTSRRECEIFNSTAWNTLMVYIPVPPCPREAEYAVWYGWKSQTLGHRGKSQGIRYREQAVSHLLH